MLLLEAAKKLNIDIPAPAVKYLTEQLPVWQRIYKGTDVPWATVARANVDKARTRMLLKPAATVARYIARLNTAECGISLSPDNVKSVVNTVLDGNDFYRNLKKLDERKEALGGAVLKPYLSGGRIHIDFVLPNQFVPLAWDNTGVTEAMFYGRIINDKGHFTHVETHRFNSIRGTKMLIISTYLFASPNDYQIGDLVPLGTLPALADVPERVEIDRDKPLFAYIYPGMSNNIDLASPLGVSRFADALDAISAVDIAFDELQVERLMAEKMIFVSQFMMDNSIDVEGMPKLRYNKDTRIYQMLSLETAEKQMPETFDPSFRISEHRLDLQTQLDLLCFKTGLDIGSMSFDGQQGIKTATEIRSENSKTYQVVADNQAVLRPAIELMIDSIVFLAGFAGILPGGAAADEISVTFDDSVTPDRDSYIREGVLLHSSGLISTQKFLREYLEMSEDDAAAEMAQIATEQGGLPDDIYGGI